MIRWLLSFLRRDGVDVTWKPTGLRFTTARDYEQDKASAMYERSRRHTATGRKLAKPRLVKSDRRDIKGNVVDLPAWKSGAK